ncbi:hypothetical protein NDU88_004396, partial [Pleurodeles waltl]
MHPGYAIFDPANRRCEGWRYFKLHVSSFLRSGLRQTKPEKVEKTMLTTNNCVFREKFASDKVRGRFLSDTRCLAEKGKMDTMQESSYP